MTFRRFILAGALCAAVVFSQSPVMADETGQSTQETGQSLQETATTITTVMPDEGRIASGVHIAGVDVSNMTVEEATAAVNAYYGALASTPININIGGTVITDSASAVAYAWDTTGAVITAYATGREGGLLSRYRTLTDICVEPVTYNAAGTIDENLLTEFVNNEIMTHNTDPVNAQITVDSSGAVEITGGTDGVVIDREAATQAIREAFTTPREGATVEIAAVVTPPDITAEELSSIQDCLGTYSTDYSSSSSGRASNIKTAAGRLNGKILMPGESLSVSDTILPREPEYGYKLGIQYNNGTSEYAYGGGVCQVSTTLYNALLRAELQVDERHNHSMTVSYVPYSADAAIAEGVKDLVFTNNLETPIYIYASASGGTLTFSIYGKEYRPENRTVEFESHTISKSYSGGSHPEVTSYLDKVVYVDGVETERTTLHTDSYSASGSSSSSSGSSYSSSSSRSSSSGSSSSSSESSSSSSTTSETEDSTTGDDTDASAEDA